jgi:hypothetical protein
MKGSREKRKRKEKKEGGEMILEGNGASMDTTEISRVSS